MGAKELLDQHHLSAAIAELNQDIKRHPTDLRLRTFLFELLCFAGDYERGQRQLDVIGHQNVDVGIGVEVYKSILRAEAARRQVFIEGIKPTFLSDPPEHVVFSLDAQNQLREGHAAEAKELYERAQRVRPEIRGRVKGHPFTSFRDSDDRLAGILEVIVRDSYIWLPFERIRKVVIPQPKHLRDLLWMPATLEIEGRPSGDVFLPVLYAGSEREVDDKVRLGRMTEWLDLGAGLAGGVGRKTFFVDDRDVSILEIGELEFEVLAAV
jgi:type VI secretion system protein ImpE